jgi:hypothetical protein
MLVSSSLIWPHWLPQVLASFCECPDFSSVGVGTRPEFIRLKLAYIFTIIII